MSSTFEKLPPELLISALLDRKSQLDSVISNLQKEITAAPEGQLRLSTNKGTRQYYQVTTSGSKTYIPKRSPAISKLAQKTYDQNVLAELKLQTEAINRLITELQLHDYTQVYNKLSTARQKLVTPITLPIEKYIEQWQNVSYNHKPFSEHTPELCTAKGERVRSKSEIIIADTLSRLGIPYRYEYPVTIMNYTFHPDFYCLNVKTRKEIVWEHLGMMSKPDYAEKNIAKMHVFQKAGYIIGKNLIITTETDGNPINSRQIEQLAKAFLL